MLTMEEKIIDRLQQGEFRDGLVLTGPFFVKRTRHARRAGRGKAS